MIKLDEYGEAINGRETYKFIAEYLLTGKSILIGWTDEMGTHFDILFTYTAIVPMINTQTIQRGVRGGDLFVSVMSKGAFGFEVNDMRTHPAYFAEKLMPSGIEGCCISKFGELLNGVKYELYQLTNKK